MSDCVLAEGKRINQRENQCRKGVLGKCCLICINQINSDFKKPKGTAQISMEFYTVKLFNNCTTTCIYGAVYNYLLIKS